MQQNFSLFELRNNFRFLHRNETSNLFRYVAALIRFYQQRKTALFDAIHAFDRHCHNAFREKNRVRKKTQQRRISYEIKIFNPCHQ